MLVSLFAAKGFSRLRTQNLRDDGAGGEGLPQSAQHAPASQKALSKLADHSSSGVGIYDVTQKPAPPVSAKQASEIVPLPYSNGAASGLPTPDGPRKGKEKACKSGKKGGSKVLIGDHSSIGVTEQPKVSLAEDRPSKQNTSEAGDAGSVNQAEPKAPKKHHFGLAGLLARMRGRHAPTEASGKTFVDPLASSPLGSPAPATVLVSEQVNDPSHRMAASPLGPAVPSGLLPAGINTSASAMRSPLPHNQGLDAPPSSPCWTESVKGGVQISTNPAFGLQLEAAMETQDDLDIDMLLQETADVGTPRQTSAGPHLARHPSGGAPSSGARSRSPPSQAGSLWVSAPSRQVRSDQLMRSQEWEVDSSSMAMSSLPNEWFETFSDGSYIKDLHNDNHSVDGDRSEDGAGSTHATPSTTRMERTFEPPASPSAGKGHRRPGSLLEISTKEQRRAMRDPATSRPRRPLQATAVGPSVPGARSTCGRPPVEFPSLGPSGPALGTAQPGQNAHRMPGGTAGSAYEAPARQDWEYLLMQRDSNNVRGTVRPAGAVESGAGVDQEAMEARRDRHSRAIQDSFQSTHSSSSGNPFDMAVSTTISEFLTCHTALPHLGSTMSTLEMSDAVANNPLFYDKPILATCDDSEDALSSSVGPSTEVGRAFQNPAPPSGDAFWEAFKTITAEDHFRPAMYMPEGASGVRAESSQGDASMLGSQGGLMLTSMFSSDAENTVSAAGPSEAGPSEISIPMELAGTMRRAGWAVDCSQAGASSDRASIHDSLSTLPVHGERLEGKQPAGPNPAILTMRDMV